MIQVLELVIKQEEYHRGPGSSNTLEYVSIASEGNPIDFGDLLVRYIGARKSSTRGIFLGGNNTPAGRSHY